MSALSRLRPPAEGLFDNLYSWIPQNPSPPDTLKHCQIVGHRGQVGPNVFENTLEAFDHCLKAGVWGIEFDIRWTLDNEPIVLHDSDAGRVFQRSDVRPAEMKLYDLRRTLPQIPTLEEVIESFGGKVHLMIELKVPLGSGNGLRQQRLRGLLRKLQAGADYHFLSLKPEYFDGIQIVPAEALLPVAELNTSELSQLALVHHWGGLSGHFWLLNDKILKNHKNKSQKIGTGFISSKNCLYRELNRGVDWIFTNRPVWLQRLVNQLAAELSNR